MGLRRKYDPRSASLIEHAYARTGSMLTASRLAAFVLAWGHVRDELGRSPSIDEYAELWGEHRATAYRALALFRESFPGNETPDAMLDLMAAARAAATDRLDLSGLVAA